MTTNADHSGTDRLTPTASRTTAQALRAVAEALDANPGMSMGAGLDSVLAYVGSLTDPVDNIGRFTRAALAVGATITKEYGDIFGGIVADFGGDVVIKMYAHREQVCERVVTGSRTVTRQVRDPAALAAVPIVDVTSTEDVVEWVCAPLLGTR